MMTPKADGFYMPAEWHPQRACWLAFPCRPESWAYGLDKPRQRYAEVINAIAEFQSVKLICRPDDVNHARRLCSQRVEFITDLAIDDTWLRDTGPSYVINDQGGLRGVDWQFNAWGEMCECLADYRHDVDLATNWLQREQCARYAAPLVLEGGAIHVDGEGTLLTSEACLLNPNRNPHLSQGDIETYLQDYLNIRKIIWLGEGLDNDETAGHIDNLACFVRPGVVLTLISSDPQDSNYVALQDNLQRLQAATDAQGRTLEVLTIEQPPRHHFKGARLALSYINFYLANGAVIAPTFDNDEYDTAALEVLKQAFPEREIVPIPGLDIVYGGGCIHCITQQEPLA